MHSLGDLLGRQYQRYSQVLLLFPLSSSARSGEAAETVKPQCESYHQVGGSCPTIAPAHVNHWQGVTLIDVSIQQKNV